MKLVLSSLLSVSLTFAASDFSTGQAARLIIGQITFTDQSPTSSASIVGAVSGLAVAGDTLFVSDSARVEGSTPQNHRVLLFKNLSSNIPKPTDEYFWTRPCPACIGTADLVLGQTDFTTRDYGLKQEKLRTPTGIASDGTRLIVADTDNNRVLIWNRIPTANTQPADVVIGQPDFTKAALPPGLVPTAQSLRGPQGVWIQNGKLYIADTQNHRVLIYNSIPTANNAAADLVLGQPSLTTAVPQNLAEPTPKANNLLNPVSVTSDGQRLYISDLGHNRILIWNSIPTTNQQAADVVIGQPDMESWLPNNSEKLCESNGVDPDDSTIKLYPKRCLSTLDFPRYALSDGKRLFIADGGSDRVLIYNTVPTRNAQPADVVLGQLGGGINQASEASDSMRTPMALAWDGTNLYVSDTFNRRILIYSPAERNIPYTGVRNAASRDVYALGTVSFGGTVLVDEEIVLKVGFPDATGTSVDKEYKYKVIKDDTVEKIVNKLFDLINAPPGDPNVIAIPNAGVGGLILTSRRAGAEGNSITFSATITPVNSTTAQSLQVTTSGAALTGGQDAARIAPGTIVSILGDNLSELTASAPADANPLPNTMANTQVYFDGIRAPLLYVSPTQINAQIPFEVRDRTSLNAWVRTLLSDGTVRVTAPVSVSIVIANPGIFAEGGSDPRVGVVYHASEFATGTLSIDGAVAAGETIILIIDGREYRYTVVAEDTLDIARDRLLQLINADEGARVRATPGRTFTRIRLQAKEAGESGVGIRFGGGTYTSATAGASATGKVTFGGTLQAGEQPVITLGLNGVNTDYSTTVLPSDTVSSVMNRLAALINADRASLAAATVDESATLITLSARTLGETGNSISLLARVVGVAETTATLTATASAATLTGGTKAGGQVFATGKVTFGGTLQAGEQPVITLGLNGVNTDYSTTVLPDDTVSSVMNRLAAVINADRATLAAAAVDESATLISLSARTLGETGNTIALLARVIGVNDGAATLTATASAATLAGGVNADGQTTISNYTPALCCPNKGLVTPDNPALPGEQLLVYTTGVGEPLERSAVTGEKYPLDGPLTEPVNFMNSLVGGRTANILYARLMPGTVGVYEVLLELNADLPTDPLTQMWVAQDIYISNIVTIPVFNPTPPE